MRLVTSKGSEPLTYSMRTRLSERLSAQAALVSRESAGQQRWLSWQTQVTASCAAVPLRSQTPRQTSAGGSAFIPRRVVRAAESWASQRHTGRHQPARGGRHRRATAADPGSGPQERADVDSRGDAPKLNTPERAAEPRTRPARGVWVGPKNRRPPRPAFTAFST
jgi:hypothetical protein